MNFCVKSQAFIVHSGWLLSHNDPQEKKSIIAVHLLSLEAFSSFIHGIACTLLSANAASVCTCLF